MSDISSKFEPGTFNVGVVDKGAKLRTRRLSQIVKKRKKNSRIVLIRFQYIESSCRVVYRVGTNVI